MDLTILGRAMSLTQIRLAEMKNLTENTELISNSVILRFGLWGYSAFGFGLMLFYIFVFSLL